MSVHAADTQPRDPASTAPPRPPRVVPVLLLVLGLIVAGVALVLVVRDADEPLAGFVRQPALQVGGIELVDHATGQAVSTDLVPPSGELTLAYLGYLSCPDICPTTMADIRVAATSLSADVTDRVTVAFLTVDPERDTGTEIAGWLGQFFDDTGIGYLALRADGATSLSDAADRLGASFEVEPHAPGQERYAVGHTAILAVIDDTGTVVRELPYGVTPDQIAAVVRAAL